MFFIKIFAGIISGSIAIIADALNSLLDVISSVVVFWAVKVSHKDADEEHAFGHHRAEPIAGLVIAIFAGVVGFEILRSAVSSIIFKESVVHFGYLAFSIIIVSIIFKLFLYFYF